MRTFKLLAVVLPLAATPTLAASLPNSPCRGLAETECKVKEVITGQKACLWIGGYRTVAGTERKPYCRMSQKRAAN
jgi:hypothetical protein